MKTLKSTPISRMPRYAKRGDAIFEYFMVFFLIILLLYLIIYAFNLWPAITTGVNLVTVAGVSVSIYALLWQLRNSLKARTISVKLGLDASVLGRDVLIKASLTNDGTEILYPQITKLFIMEGVKKELHEVGVTKFPPITEHKHSRFFGQCFSCYAKESCMEDLRRNEGLYPSFPVLGEERDFVETIKLAHNLRLLSYHSMLLLRPKDTCNEDIVFSLPKPGFYRFLMVYNDKRHDCFCRSCVVKIE